MYQVDTTTMPDYNRASNTNPLGASNDSSLAATFCARLLTVSNLTIIKLLRRFVIINDDVLIAMLFTNPFKIITLKLPIISSNGVTLNGVGILNVT